MATYKGTVTSIGSVTQDGYRLSYREDGSTDPVDTQVLIDGKSDSKTLKSYIGGEVTVTTDNNYVTEVDIVPLGSNVRSALVRRPPLSRAP